MSLQNIGASNSDDAFYRYKMPRMVTKIEGRGNGIKTNVVNMVEIAKALARPPAYTTKYFGNELGAQSKFDEKTGTALVNGAHETAKLAGLLEHFIKKYVQCYGCGNPETEILISKTQMISLKCAACGFISDVDMRDKLTTFIIKNPPENKKGGKDKKAMRRAEKERLKEGEAADEEQKKLKKESTKKKVGSAHVKDTHKNSKKKESGSDEDHSPPLSHVDDVESPVEHEEEDDGVQWQTDTSLAATQQRMQEQLSAVTAEMVMLATEEKAKPDAHGRRVEEVKQQMRNCSEREVKGYLAGVTWTGEEAARAVVCAVLEGVEKGVAREVVKKKGVIMGAGRGDDAQGCLLDAIGYYFEKVNGEAVKEVAVVLKAMYDNDMVEEDAIIKWYTKLGNDAAVAKTAKPFIDWLENAESESDSDDH